jgi:xanthine dehydrogenase accessory factor
MSTWRRILLSAGRGTPARDALPPLARRRSSERSFRRGSPLARNVRSPSVVSMNRELAAMITLANRLVASGIHGTLSTLFAARGSTYRSLGAMMVSLPGTRAGGISGGCLEEHVARAGARATQDAPAVMLRFSTHPDSDDDAPILGCGGSIDVLVERLTADHVTLLEEFARASERDECALLACVVRRAGQALSIRREWLGAADGAHCATPDLGRICGAVAREARSRHAALDSDADVLVQYVPPVTRLLIFGAGDDAQPLCEIGTLLGWHVSVADRRSRLATAARFPEAQKVVAADWDEVVNTLCYSGRTAAVLMTHSLDDDARVLSALSRRQLSYIGALGPAHRRRWLLEEVAALGVRLTDDARLKLRGPIGLDLGDRSAAGIAVAAVAEILAHFNARDAQPLHSKADTATIEGRPGACLVA